MNTDAFYLLVLAGAGAYAIKNIEKRPRSHLIEGFGDDPTEKTSQTKTALDTLMGKITKYYKKDSGESYDVAVGTDGTVTSDYNIGNVGEEAGTGTLLESFNPLITAADDANIGTGFIPTVSDHQIKLISLRQTLAEIYGLVSQYSIEQDDAIMRQKEKVALLSDMEELNRDSIVDTTATLLEQGNNKRRLIQNNEYFLNRYRSINDILRYLILFIVTLTIIQYLNIKGFFGESLGGIFVPVTISVFIFILWFKYNNITRRNPNNFDEIVWNDLVPGKKAADQ